MYGNETRWSGSTIRTGTSSTRFASVHRPSVPTPENAATPAFRPCSRSMPATLTPWNRRPNEITGHSARTPRYEGKRFVSRLATAIAREPTAARKTTAVASAQTPAPERTQRDRPAVVREHADGLDAGEHAEAEGPRQHDLAGCLDRCDRQAAHHHGDDGARRAEERGDGRDREREHAGERQLEPEHRLQLLPRRVLGTPDEAAPEAAVGEGRREDHQRRPDRDQTEVGRHEHAREHDVAAEPDQQVDRAPGADEEDAARDPSAQLPPRQEIVPLGGGVVRHLMNIGRTPPPRLRGTGRVD